MTEKPPYQPVQKCHRQSVIHEPHEWDAGRWRVKMRLCPGVEAPPVPWEAKQYRKADALIRKVWDLHGTPVTHDRPGFGGVGRTFWCSHCRMPWPCDTARLVINWGELTERDYEPLRLIERPASVDSDSPSSAHNTPTSER